MSGSCRYTRSLSSPVRLPVQTGLLFLSNETRQDVFVSCIIIFLSLSAKSRLSNIATFSVL